MWAYPISPHAMGELKRVAMAGAVASSRAGGKVDPTMRTPASRAAGEVGRVGSGEPVREGVPEWWQARQASQELAASTTSRLPPVR